MDTNQNGIIENYNHSTRIFFLLGAIAGLIVLLGSLSDLVIGFTMGGSLTSLSQTAVGRFEQFHSNWLLGLYNMDMLNVCTTLIMIPAFYGIYTAHRKIGNPLALFSLIIFIIGTAYFITNNTALAMLDLSRKYFTASTPGDKILFSAAGTELLVRGAHGGLGSFLGFFLLSISELLLSFVMLFGKIFSRVNAIIGIIGVSFLLIYSIIITFVPSAQSLAVIFAAPGGILAMIWIFMFSLKLFYLSGRKFYI